jgi:D-glycero-D-manno-heptose 1,7-bisphosphate phosphatase
MAIRHIILDRDGVLNDESESFIAGPADWRWLPGSLEALSLFTRAGLRLSVVTNQASVGRGLLAPEALEAIHAGMTREASEAGGTIHAIFVCPHAPAEECQCRKPAPGLIKAAIASAGIPPSDTLLVGDDGRDIDAAQAAGIDALLVLTGKGRETARSPYFHHIPVYDDLRAVAEALTVHPQTDKRAS